MNSNPKNLRTSHISFLCLLFCNHSHSLSIKTTPSNTYQWDKRMQIRLMASPLWPLFTWIMNYCRQQPPLASGIITSADTGCRSSVHLPGKSSHPFTFFGVLTLQVVGNLFTKTTPQLNMSGQSGWLLVRNDEKVDLLVMVRLAGSCKSPACCFSMNLQFHAPLAMDCHLVKYSNGSETHRIE
ncbi:hypothetical protein Ancab_027670 [Ancistrocladus abbreviatus]